MSKRVPFFVGFIFCLCTLYCQNASLDPWGIWNKRLVTKADNIRIINNERFFEAGDDGLWILKDGKARFGEKVSGPIFAVTGAFIKITSYERFDNNLIFSLQGEGFRHNPKTGKPEWKDDTEFILKMVMIDKEKCMFEYITKHNEGDFKMSYLPLPGNIYYRMKE